MKEIFNQIQQLRKKMLDNIGDQFIWWYGVVENRNDPLKLGRLQVRIYTWHSSDKTLTPTNSLPWAMPIQGINSAAMGNIGKSPTGIVPASPEESVGLMHCLQKS